MDRDKKSNDPLFDREAWREYEHNRHETDFNLDRFFDHYDASQALSEFDSSDWEDAA